MPKGPLGFPRLTNFGVLVEDNKYSMSPAPNGNIVARVGMLSDEVSEVSKIGDDTLAIFFHIRTEAPDKFINRSMASTYIADNDGFREMLIRFPSSVNVNEGVLLGIGKEALSSAGIEPDITMEERTAYDVKGDYNIWVAGQDVAGKALHIGLTDEDIGDDIDNSLRKLKQIVKTYKDMEPKV